MKAVLRTDIGRVREKNEDAAHVGDGLYILCDGMGGHQAGEIASGLAVEWIAGALQGKPAGVAVLLEAVSEANKRILERSQAEDAVRGMGTTLTLLWEAAENVLLAQIGDSRAYLLRGGLLRQCTHDHSLVAEMVRTGKLTEAQARVHPQRNLVTRALGTEYMVDTDIFEITRASGDRWLLCSDGLTDLVTDEDIADILSGKDLEAAADMLLSQALRRGGTDNVTLLLLEDEGGGVA